MRDLQDYLYFIREKGKKLPDVDWDTWEMALPVEDALKAVELLKEAQKTILGGDIISEDTNGKLGYAIHIWGSEYCYLDWSCDRMNKSNQSETDCKNRSYTLAIESILKANDVAIRLNKKCYIILVIQ